MSWIFFYSHTCFRCFHRDLGNEMVGIEAKQRGFGCRFCNNVFWRKSVQRQGNSVSNTLLTGTTFKLTHKINDLIADDLLHNDSSAQIPAPVLVHRYDRCPFRLGYRFCFGCSFRFGCRVCFSFGCRFRFSARFGFLCRQFCFRLFFPGSLFGILPDSYHVLFEIPERDLPESLLPPEFFPSDSLIQTRGGIENRYFSLWDFFCRFRIRVRLLGILWLGILFLISDPRPFSHPFPVLFPGSFFVSCPDKRFKTCAVLLLFLAIILPP